MADQEEQIEDNQYAGADVPLEEDFAEEDPNAYYRGSAQVDPNAYYEEGSEQVDPSTYYPEGNEQDPDAYYEEGNEQDNPNAYYEGSEQLDPNAHYDEGSAQDPNAYYNERSAQEDPNAYYQAENAQADPNVFYQGQVDPYGYQLDEDEYASQFQPYAPDGSAFPEDETPASESIVLDILDSIVLQGITEAETLKTPEYEPQYVGPELPQDIKICDKYFIKPGQFGATFSGELIPGTGEEPPNAQVSRVELKAPEDSLASFTELVDICSIESKEKDDEDERSEDDLLFESHDSEYLKTQIGIPLTLALAEIVAKKPSDPIHYLGHWLFKWRYNQEDKQAEMDKINEIICERERIAAAALEKQRLADERLALEMADNLEEEEEEEEEIPGEMETEGYEFMHREYEEIGEEMGAREYYGEGVPEVEGEEYTVGENQENWNN